MVLAKTTRGVRRPRSVQCVGLPVQWVDTVVSWDDPWYAADIVYTSEMREFTVPPWC
jgi:hypothetical protein